MNALIVISGCSGGGKSTLLAELARRGYRTVEEPGRRIVREALQSGGSALPWLDADAFIRRVLALAREDFQAAQAEPGWIFFDRGLVDAASGLESLTGEPLQVSLGGVRYHRHVFLTPPWPEIYATDAERRHDLVEAEAEYVRLLEVYPALGYDVTVLPKVDVLRRADHIVAALAQSTKLK